jgi:hypothetical protein
MRNISSNGLAKLAQKLGTEPICIIEIDWAGIPMLYADRAVGSIPGKIIDLGALDNVTNISGSGGSQELAVTLDDTDGTLKDIFDSHDIHKRVAKVYQYFSGLDLSDKFLLFTGTVSSPVTWNERDRTVKFSIISRLETNEVGFSAEEGKFPYLPAALVGKVWPIIFGTVQNVPALKVNQAIIGTTLNGIGILAGVDIWFAQEQRIEASAFFNSLAMAETQRGWLNLLSSCWQLVDAKKSNDYLDQANQISEQIGKSIISFESQQACAATQHAQNVARVLAASNGGDTIQILGGEDFPQGQELTLNINGGYFTGTFNGNVFTVSGRVHPELEAQAASDFSYMQSQIASCQPEPQVQEYNFQAPVPCDGICGDYLDPCTATQQGSIITTPQNPLHTQPVAQAFWADAGSQVSILGQEPKTYIVSITPGTVLSVKAYKSWNGGQTLMEVPKDLYTVETQNYGPINAVQVVLNQPLSQIFNSDVGVYEGWSDDLYVTFQSTIGPNIVDIIKYLITNHTDLTWDGATGPGIPVDLGPTGPSFDHCYHKLIPFPANFAVLDRKDILQLLQDIAFQSRCAIWLDDDVFKMKYLPETPSPIDTIVASDIDAENGIEVSLTPTENLITKMQVSWRLSLASFSSSADPDMIMIFRHNLAKYGLTEQTYDWYIFNQPDIIYKMATFWLMRNSITWKTVKFQCYLSKLNLEVFDAVTLDLPQVATDPVLAMITKASYNSVDHAVDIECALPVEAGSMVPNPFYWPAASTERWPPQADIDNGDVGGTLRNVVGNLPIGDVSTFIFPDEQVVIVGGINVVFAANSDWGDRTPSDTGFTAQTILDSSMYAGFSGGSRPSTLIFDAQYPSPQELKYDLSQSGITLDIRKTKVFDSRNPSGKPAYLDSIFRGIVDADVPSGRKLVVDRTNTVVGDDSTPNGQPLSDVFKNGASYLSIRTDVSIWSSDHPDDAHFDFKFNNDATDLNKWGAGTAFLKD